MADDYDSRRHGEAGAPHAQPLTDAFIDDFGAVGSAERVFGKVSALADLGLDRIVIASGSRDVRPDRMEEGSEVFAREVLPELRRRASVRRAPTMSRVLA